MAKSSRTPINSLESLVTHGATSWPTGPAPGDHLVKLSISVDYALCRVGGTEMLSRSKGSTKPKPDIKKKRGSVDEYKRLYITYSIGGQVEGKTETFAITGNDWTVTQDINVTNDFLSALYGKPTEFVIWEIIRTEDREREIIQNLRRNVHHFGLMPSLLSGPHIGIDGVNDGISPMVIAAATASAFAKTASSGGHGGAGGNHAEGVPKNGAIANNHRVELFGNKLPMSLAQTGLLKRHQQQLKKQKQNQQERHSVYGDTAALEMEEAFEPNPSRSRPSATLKSRMPAEASDHHARGTSDSSRIGRDFTRGIHSRLSRRQSSSTPDLGAGLHQGIHEFKNISKRNNSDSPPLDRYRPGSPLHRFLIDDFGVSRQQQETGRPASRNSARETPHPHHYDHPEKHVSPELMHRGLLRSRSSSSIASLQQLHPKTPPSPHHHDHPLKTLAPRGHVKAGVGTRSGANSTAASVATTTRSRKGDKAKPGDKHTDKSLHQQVGQTTRDKHQKDTYNNKDATFRHADRVGRTNRAEMPGNRDDPRRIRWDAESNTSNRAINWSELPLEEAERRTNDQVIEMPAEKLLLEKKKGEYTHIPIGKVVLDVTDLFFDALETKASVVQMIDGLEKCDMVIRLDGPLLSPEQAMRLNPMRVTIGTMDGMPSKPLSYAELDDKCLPVSVKFRLYADPFVHSAILVDEPHAERLTFNSQHLILAGMMDPERLRDEIFKGPVVIEVHDRDHRLPADLAKINADLRDDGFITSSMNPLNPFGEASFWLDPLAYGQTEIHLSAPILPERTPATKSKRALPPGLWLESSANLTASICVRFPIVTGRPGRPAASIAPAIALPVPTSLSSTAAAAETTASTTIQQQVFPRYAHIVILTSSRNGSVPKIVHDIVTRINAETLKIPASAGRPDLALATYQLTEDQRKSTSLDLLTGYDVFDSRSRVMFIEGLIDGGVQKLLTGLAELMGSPDVHIWHSPTNLFNKPFCSGLTPVVMHVQLEPDLAEIIANKSTYVRGRMSRDCFDGLETIRQAVELTAQSESGHAKVFPLQRMMLGLIGVFGQIVPFEDSIPVGEFAEIPMVRPVMSALPELSPGDSGGMNGGIGSSHTIAAAVGAEVGTADKKVSRRAKLPYGRNGEPVNHPLIYNMYEHQSVIEHENTDTIIRMRMRHLRQPNFVRLNVNARDQAKTRPRERGTDHTVYNYSMQALSAAQKQLDDLRTVMSKDKTHHYAYCLEYFSQTVEPTNSELESKHMEIESHRKWKTLKGFRAGPIADLKSTASVTDMRHAELLQPWKPPHDNLGTILRDA